MSHSAEPRPEAPPIPLDNWVAARVDPESYPGDRPKGAFLVTPRGVLEAPQLDGAPIRSWLQAQSAARSEVPWEQRIPIVAYGANRNPASLALKLEQHAYAGETDWVIAAEPIQLDDVDAAAAGLSDQGYLYAELVASPGTRLDAVLLWVDAEQMRVLHDSEFVREGEYAVAVTNVRGAAGDPHPALVYLTGRVISYPGDDRPRAFSALAAEDRRFVERDARGLLAELLATTALGAECAALLRLAEAPAALAAGVAQQLHDDWWARRDGAAGGEPATAMLAAIRGEIVVRLRPSGAAEALGARVLTIDAAYDPDAVRRATSRSA